MTGHHPQSVVILLKEGEGELTKGNYAGFFLLFFFLKEAELVGQEYVYKFSRFQLRSEVTFSMFQKATVSQFTSSDV